MRERYEPAGADDRVSPDEVLDTSGPDTGVQDWWTGAGFDRVPTPSGAVGSGHGTVDRVDELTETVSGGPYRRRRAFRFRFWDLVAYLVGAVVWVFAAWQVVCFVVPEGTAKFETVSCTEPRFGLNGWCDGRVIVDGQVLFEDRVYAPNLDLVDDGGDGSVSGQWFVVRWRSSPSGVTVLHDHPAVLTGWLALWSAPVLFLTGVAAVAGRYRLIEFFGVFFLVGAFAAVPASLLLLSWGFANPAVTP